MNSSLAITNIKNAVITTILLDKDILDAIDVPYTDPSELIYKNIWPYARIPNTEVEKTTYICVKVDIDTDGTRNSAIKNVLTTIYVMAEQGIMRVNAGVAKGSTRIDFISQRLEEVFNHADDIGLGETALLTNYEDVLEADTYHQCRVLRFKSYWTNAQC